MLEQPLNTVMGLELILLGDNLYRCHACLLSKKGSILGIQSKSIMEGTLVQVLEKIPRNYPIALNLTGKGILFKHLTDNGDRDVAEVFSSVFPGVLATDFYVQQFSSGKHSVLSIMRRTATDIILQTFRQSGIKVLALTFGASVTSCIWSLLELDGMYLSFQGHQFKLDGGMQLLEYNHRSIIQSEQIQNIAGQELADKYLIAYAAAFQLLLYKQMNMLWAEVPEVKVAFENFLQDSILKKRALVFMGILFLSLITSFLVFSHYNSENSRLSGVAGTLAASENQLDLFKQDIAEQEALLKKVSWNGGYPPGFVLKEISSTCPRQLSLLKISMNPLSKEPTDERPVILLSGLSGNLTAVNNWIFLLKERKWVKLVKLQGYSADPESGNYRFNLKIGY
ncbi:hypothetical protein QWY86_15585 [Pedobacter aquatilis]|uniref:hypothetical protein n=1 Tax=Pedobacter aquatilis TaxID=351343 RepID=UPI0025B5E2CB|nr:hypothetical protein [Pedobacter aquatilis]MDN3588105.1 hypothetical protein [Pedobacter aquatilis]